MATEQMATDMANRAPGPVTPHAASTALSSLRRGMDDLISATAGLSASMPALGELGPRVRSVSEQLALLEAECREAIRGSVSGPAQ